MEENFMDKVVLFDIDYTLFNTAVFKETNLSDFSLYEEVLDTISELQNIARLGIFSEGDLIFQETKLHKTAIHGRFLKSHMHIVANKEEVLADVLNKYRGEKLFLVDDKLQVLRLAKEQMPAVFTIWIKRGPFAESEQNSEGFVPDATINTLREVVEIVANTN